MIFGNLIFIFIPPQCSRLTFRPTNKNSVAWYKKEQEEFHSLCRKKSYRNPKEAILQYLHFFACLLERRYTNLTGYCDTLVIIYVLFYFSPQMLLRGIRYPHKNRSRRLIVSGHVHETLPKNTYKGDAEKKALSQRLVSKH
jgi:hypothetical protein